MDLFIKEAFCKAKCMEKESIFGQNLGIGTREIILTIIEMAMELIINRQANLI